MRIDTLGVLAFVAIAEQGTFNKAAKSLFISQAALSKRIKNLEQHLGLLLFERTTRSCRLSPAGRALLPRAQRFISDFDSALMEIRGESALSEVTIACVASMTSLLLPKALEQFSSRFPSIRIRILDVFSPDVPKAVIAKAAHFGVAVLPTGAYPDLDTITLFRDPFVFMCRNDHPLSNRRRLSWREIRGEALIRIGRSISSGLLLDSVLQEENLEIQNRYEVQHLSTAFGLVASGACTAVLPSLFLAKDIHPRLRSIPLIEPTISRPFSLIRRRDELVSPAAEALYTIVKNILLKDIKPTINRPIRQKKVSSAK